MGNKASVERSMRKCMCEQAQEQRKQIEALKTAAEEVLRVYVPQFPNSLAVDDCLVGLAAVVAAVEG